MSQEEYIRRYSELQNAARESVFKDFDGADERARRALQEEFFSRQAPQEAPEAPAAPRLSPKRTLRELGIAKKALRQNKSHKPESLRNPWDAPLILKLDTPKSSVRISTIIIK